MNKQNQQKIIKHDRYINIILAIMLLVSIIWWVVDEEKDNQKERILTQGILEYQAYVEGSDKYIGLLPTVTKLYNELQECQNANN